MKHVVVCYGTVTVATIQWPAQIGSGQWPAQPGEV